eukprot:g2823.t1
MVTVAAQMMELPVGAGAAATTGKARAVTETRERSAADWHLMPSTWKEDVVSSRGGQKTIDRDLRRLASFFGIDEVTLERLDELMEKHSPEQRRRDLAKLYEILETARSPSRLLMAKTEEMEDGQFVTNFKRDEHIDRLCEQYRLNDAARCRLDHRRLEEHLQMCEDTSFTAESLIKKVTQGRLSELPDLSEAKAIAAQLDQVAQRKLREVHAISYILLITCGSPIHVDLFELKGLSADMAAAMAAGFSGPMPHALMCTMPTRPPILNVPDADPPRLNVGGCSLAHGHANEGDWDAYDDDDPVPTKGCINRRAKQRIEQDELLEFLYPLHLAVKMGDAKLVSLLLRAGADKDQESSKGRRPMEVLAVAFSPSMTFLKVVDTYLAGGLVEANEIEVIRLQSKQQAKRQKKAQKQKKKKDKKKKEKSSSSSSSSSNGSSSSASSTSSGKKKKKKKSKKVKKKEKKKKKDKKAKFQLAPDQSPSPTPSNVRHLSEGFGKVPTRLRIAYVATDPDADTFDQAFKENNLKTLVELLDSSQAVDTLLEPKHPWAEDPRTVGALSAMQLAMLASMVGEDDASVREDIGKAGAIPPLADSTQAAVVALKYLTEESGLNARAAYEAGALPVLIELLKHPLPGLRGAAASGLRNMSVSTPTYAKPKWSLREAPNKLKAMAQARFWPSLKPSLVNVVLLIGVASTVCMIEMTCDCVIETLLAGLCMLLGSRCIRPDLLESQERPMSRGRAREVPLLSATRGARGVRFGPRLICGVAANISMSGDLVAGVTPNQTSYAMLIQGWARAGELTLAARWMERLCSSGHRPNEGCFLALLVAFCQRKDLNSAEATVQEMVQEYPHLRPQAHTILVDAYAKEGNLQRAEHWMRPIAQDGEATVVSYGAILDACAKTSHAVKAMEWLGRRLVPLGGCGLDVAIVRRA